MMNNSQISEENISILDLLVEAFFTFDINLILNTFFKTKFQSLVIKMNVISIHRPTFIIFTYVTAQQLYDYIGKFYRV